MYHDKNLAISLVLAIACAMIACEQQRPGPTASKGRDPSATYPTTLADINSWHGIQVTKPKVNTWVECHLSFPTDFGSTQEEKIFLVYLVSQRSEINDKDCQFSPIGAYQALDQLLRLAANKQDSVAAHILLSRGFLDVPFNLDGEMLEGYTESYLVPVLEKFEKLDSVLDKNQEDAVIRSVCSLRVKTEDLKDIALKKRIDALVARLRLKGKDQMARQIESCK